MSAPLPERLVYSVFCLSDFSPESEVAFAHALAIALTRGSDLTILRAGKGDSGEAWRRLPGVRKTLERWGLLGQGSQRSDVFDKYGVKVKKVNLGTGRQVSAILDYLGDSPSELIVAAYDSQQGIGGIARDSTKEDVARRSGAMALFIPSRCLGFVSPSDGSLSLRRILVPIADDPPPELAIEAAIRTGEWLGDPPVELTLLHVGEGPAPKLNLEDSEKTTFRVVQRQGDVVDAIIAQAEETDADLISMVTNGRSSLGEAVKGSHTERVIRRAGCPVLALPESWGERL